MIGLAILAQAVAATPAAPAARPQRWSILAPQSCPAGNDKEDIVVCGDGKNAQRLPLPDAIEPPAGRGANPDLSTSGVFALEAPPCGAMMKGCTVGVAPPIVPIATALVKVARSAFARRPDKRGRVAIDLSEPAAR